MAGARDLKEAATVVESDVHEEPEAAEQLHPTEGESKQTKPSESYFGKERLSGVLVSEEVMLLQVRLLAQTT